MSKHQASSIKRQASQRELIATFSSGLAVTLLAGAALGVAAPPAETRETPQLVEPRAPKTAEASTIQRLPEDGHAELCGIQESDLDVQLQPAIVGNQVQFTLALSNRTKSTLAVASVAQLVALDGSVVEELPASQEGDVESGTTLESSTVRIIAVPTGYYTLWITTLASGTEESKAAQTERTAQAVLYLQSDGAQTHLVDFADWYFNSGAVEFGPVDEEQN